MSFNEKLKVYLDTSALSYLQQDDSPEKTRITLALWEMFKTDKYDVCMSQVTFDEALKCKEPKLSFLREKIKEIKYTNFQLTSEVAKLSKEIISKGILTEKSTEDCLHIAVAIMNECDLIISWNFKHLVNIKTIRGVRAITNIKGYKGIEIMTPETLLLMEV